MRLRTARALRRVAATALLLPLLAAPAPAGAQEDGVFFDDSGPAAREYELPFDAGRREGGGGSSTRSSAVPFGVGIEPSASSAAGDSGDSGSAGGRGRRGGGDSGDSGDGGGVPRSIAAAETASSDGPPAGLWVASGLIALMFGWVLLGRFRGRRGESA